MRPTMKPIICFLNLFIIAAALVGSGCSTSNQIKKKSELMQLEGNGPIRILTVDSLLYSLEAFSFTDSLINGRGTLKDHNLSTLFDGSIPFSQIVFIEGLETSYWKAFWVVPMVAGVVGGLFQMFDEPSSFEIYRPSYGSSCPYVYAFDGKQFKLEAEAFGTSISKALEAKTYNLLPSLVPVDGQLIVRVSNERPETHLLNSVHLYVAEAPRASLVVLDVDNILWPLRNAVPPSSACDQSGMSILTNLEKKDGCYWKSDLTHTAPFSGFRDELEIQFDVPPGASEASIVIDAINTELITEVYRTVGTILGDATMQFYRALEQDRELQSDIRKWLRECNLRIEVQNGNIWKEVDMMQPEANVASFSRAIRIGNLDGLRGPLRVRLSSLTDVWRIDAVSIDFSSVQPLSLYPLEIISVKGSDNIGWENAIKSTDSTYAIILPPNYLDISFNSVAAIDIQNPVYIFAAQGYLYEWFATQTESTSSIISETLGDSNRIEMLKLLIKQKDLFLPPIYAGWRKANEEKSVR